MPKEHEDVEATLEQGTTPDTSQKEKWRAIDWIAGGTVIAEVLWGLWWLVTQVFSWCSWTPPVNAEHFAQFYCGVGLGILSFGYLILILWPIIFKQGKGSKQDNDPRWFHARILSSGIVGGSYAFLLPAVMGLEEGSVTSGGAAALRQAILLATGGLIALIALGETRRKNDNDREAAESLQKHQQDTLNQQKKQFEKQLEKQQEQFEANAFKERKAERRERYTKAVEQLGDEKAPIRMGGVYTLVGLVDEWLEEDKLSEDERIKEGQVIINSLCAYIRSPFTLASHYDELSRDTPTSEGTYKDREQEFYAEKAILDSEADVRLGIIKEIHYRLQDPEKNTPGTWSDFEYDFSGSTFFYPVDLSDSYYLKSVNFGGSIYQNTADFSGSTYQNTASFGGSTYQRWANFSDSTYQGWISFGGSIYQGSTYFVGSVYPGLTSFGSSTYQDSADFSASSYQESANFSRSSYQESANFSNSSYQGYADFSGSKYMGGADFSGSTYDKDVTFSNHRYYSIYFGEAKFRESTYRYLANFSHSIYQGFADFVGSSYQNEVYFSYSIYRVANFRGSKYHSSVYLNSSTYEGHAYFSGSIYWGLGDFSNSTYESRTDFENSSYLDYADFSGSTYKQATFSGSIFYNKIYFCNTKEHEESSRFANCIPKFYNRTYHKNTLFGSSDNDFTVDTNEGYPINLNSEGIPFNCKLLTPEQKEYLKGKLQEVEKMNNKLLEVKDSKKKAELSINLHSLNEEIHEWRKKNTIVKVEDVAAEDTES